MNEGTAKFLVTSMNAVFPPTLSEIGFQVYVRELERLVDEEAAVKAVEVLIRSSRFMPKPVDIVEEYRRHQRRRVEALRVREHERAEGIADALGLPRPEREPIPDPVREWMQAKGIDPATVLRDVEPRRGRAA